MERNNPGSGDSINTEEGVRGKSRYTGADQLSQWER